MRVTRLRRDTTLARIIHLVEAAQAQRAPAQAFVERFARYYTPVVIAIAVGGGPRCRRWSSRPPALDWLYRALVLLVIACPCALVISTPVSIVSALAAAARQGVLVKGGVHLERLAARARDRVRQDGHAHARPRRRSWRVTPFGGTTEARLLALAAALESRSEHPIARGDRARMRARTRRPRSPRAVPLAARARRRGGAARPSGAGRQPAAVRERGLLAPEIGGGGAWRAAADGCTAVLVAWDGAVDRDDRGGRRAARGGAGRDRPAPRPGSCAASSC